MRITPALAYEKLHQDAESQNKIILHKDGKFNRDMTQFALRQ